MTTATPTPAPTAARWKFEFKGCMTGGFIFIVLNLGIIVIGALALIPALRLVSEAAGTTNPLVTGQIIVPCQLFCLMPIASIFMAINKKWNMLIGLCFNPLNRGGGILT